eukprot:4027083-Prymnesium_polylepis.1
MDSPRPSSTASFCLSRITSSTYGWTSWAIVERSSIQRSSAFELRMRCWHEGTVTRSEAS